LGSPKFLRLCPGMQKTGVANQACCGLPSPASFAPGRREISLPLQELRSEASMSRPLRDFLLHLSDNPEATTRFGTSDETATAMMTAAGLTEDQREALLARGLAEVSAAW